MNKRYVYVKKRYIFLFSLTDAIGYFIRAVFRTVIPFSSNTLSDVKKIVVIELAHLGDVLAATPAMRLLRKKFPDARITCVVSPWGKDIVSGNPDIDEIIVYRASWFDRLDKKPFSLMETLAFIKQLRRQRFDLGIDMRGDVRVIFLMWLGKIKYRIGYGFTGGGFLLSKAVPFDARKRQDTHQIDHDINLIRAIDFGRQMDAIDRKMLVFFSEQDKAYIEGYLEENSISAEDFLIAVHSGAGLAVKCWPVEKFRLLIGQLFEKYRVKIILVGGPHELGYAHALDTKGIVNAIGYTSIKQLAALLKRSQLFIGADSGLMHIASALGTPIVAIWSGQGKPSLWTPLSEKNIIIDKPLADIAVEDVMSAVSKQMEQLKDI